MSLNNKCFSFEIYTFFLYKNKNLINILLFFGLLSKIRMKYPCNNLKKKNNKKKKKKKKKKKIKNN